MVIGKRFHLHDGTVIALVRFRPARLDFLIYQGGIEKICLREENPVFASEYFEKLSFLSFLSHGYQ